MRRSLAALKVDPAMIVQRRLPWQVRKTQLQQKLWDERDEEVEDPAKMSAIVVQIAQASRKSRKDSQTWGNLLDQALTSHAELSSQDMASILWSMADARFHHKALVEDFVRSLSFRAGVKPIVTAMLALDRLGLPTDSLRGQFLQQLSGQCEELSLGDLRRVLMALARCCKDCSVQPQLLREICDATYEKANGCDPRDLMSIPQHLGRLQYLHSPLLARSADAISKLISCRLSVLPLDVLRALDGFMVLTPLVEIEVAKQQLLQLAVKCQLLAAHLLQTAPASELWAIGAQLLGSEVVSKEVWALWISEAVQRRSAENHLSRRISGVRRQMMKQWGIQSMPEGLELAFQLTLQGK
ncbi:unnamed protein product [Effrenium voratum]|nr:unnamed protein product [Effrenium voratum]